MLAEINERSKVLNNITILILNRADEEGGPELAAATVKNFRATLRAPTLRSVQAPELAATSLEIQGAAQDT